MTTQPVRVPGTVHSELQAASRLLGKPTSELMREAWENYRQSPTFRKKFEAAQRAFVSGDLSELAEQLAEEDQAWAAERAARTRALRKR